MGTDHLYPPPQLFERFLNGGELILKLAKTLAFLGNDIGRSPIHEIRVLKLLRLALNQVLKLCAFLLQSFDLCRNVDQTGQINEHIDAL